MLFPVTRIQPNIDQDKSGWDMKSDDLAYDAFNELLPEGARLFPPELPLTMDAKVEAITAKTNALDVRLGLRGLVDY